MSTFVKQRDEHIVLISWGEKSENDQDTKIKQLTQKWGEKNNKKNKVTDKTTSAKPGKRPKFYGRVAPTVGKYNLSKINNSIEYLQQSVDAGTL